jgi:hypothetical protein
MYLRWRVTRRGSRILKLVQRMLVHELLVRGHSLLRLTWVNILSKALLGGEDADNRVLGGNGHPAAVVIV